MTSPVDGSQTSDRAQPDEAWQVSHRHTGQLSTRVRGHRRPDNDGRLRGGGSGLRDRARRGPGRAGSRRRASSAASLSRQGCRLAATGFWFSPPSTWPRRCVVALRTELTTAISLSRGISAADDGGPSQRFPPHPGCISNRDVEQPPGAHHTGPGVKKRLRSRNVPAAHGIRCDRGRRWEEKTPGHVPTRSGSCPVAVAVAGGSSVSATADERSTGTARTGQCAWLRQ